MVKHVIAAASLAMFAGGCVSPQQVVVVDKQAFAGHSCPQLEQELAKLGVITSKASNDQSMASGKQVTATILGGLVGVGSIVNYSNMRTAEKNESAAKAQLANIYSVWDEKKCSEWLYKRNSANTPAQ